jgi:WD40 repeat protein
MSGKLLLGIVFLQFLAGCSNMMKADKPDVVLPGAHEFGTTAVAFNQDGKTLLSGGHLGDIRLWDVATRKQISENRRHEASVRAILPISPGLYASGGDDGRIILWQNNQVKAEVQGARVTSLALFQDRLVSGHSDKLLRLWSPTDLTLLAEIPLDDDVVALAVRQDRLAVGLDSSIVLLDKAFKPIKTLETGGSPHDLQFSPDGRTLAAGSWFRLHVWDLDTGEMRSIPTEHNGLLTSVSFSPDGKQIVTLGRHSDSAIRIMETRNFAVLQRYQAHELCGAMIRYSPDGRMMASGSDDESVRLYDLTSKALTK